MSLSLRWAEQIGKELSYVVLRKGNRLQVILRPTAQQVRRRGKSGWRAVASGGVAAPGASSAEVPEGL